MNAPAYLAAARVARRQAVRAPWRSLLVMAMVAFPVAGLAATATVVRTAIPTDAERVREAFGTGDAYAWWNRRVTTERLAAAVPEGTRVVAEGELPVPRPLIHHSSIVPVHVLEWEARVDRPPLEGMYRVLYGQAPTAPGEAAVNPKLLDALGLRIGGAFSPRPGVDLRVTGTVAQTANVNDPVVVLGPGTLASLGLPLRTDWLIDFPPGVDLRKAINGVGRLGVGWTDRETLLQDHRRESTVWTGGAFAGAALLLLGTGLIAGAAFAVGARRQLRTLGLLGAAGAEQRHVRATVLFGGVTLGAAGSGAGVALGVAGAYASHPHLDRLVGRFVGPIEFSSGALGAAFALGTLAAALAALGPAVTAARVSVVQALAERTPPPRRPGRLALGGLVGVILGALVTTEGTRTSNDPVLTAGLALMVVGILVAIPLVVTWTGHLAGVLPTLPRIAARDLARHGRRTAAALAAGAVALGLPIAISTETMADEAREAAVPYMAPDQLELYGFADGERAARQLAAAREALAEAFPGSVSAPIVPAVRLVERHGHERERQVMIEGPEERSSDGVISRTGTLVIGGPGLLRALHAGDGIAALERGDVIGIGPDAVRTPTVDLMVGLRRGPESPVLATVAAVAAGEVGYTSLGVGNPGFVVSPDRAAELGLRPGSRPAPNVLFRAPHALSAEDVDRAKDVVSAQSDVGLQSLSDIGSEAGTIRVVATAAGMAIALVIVGVIVALLSTESRRDRAILVAIGADPRNRRTVAGASAAMIGGVSAVLAVAVGVAPTTVFLQTLHNGFPVVVPWMVIAAVVLGVPVLGAATAALTSRQPKAAALLRPIS